jgi:ABC-type nitrate/sulfonate/bicarbonate transport system substrate-binding protein
MFYVAEERGLFARHGLNLKVERHAIGKMALQAVTDGSADLALVADTPFVLAILRGEQIATVGTVYESRRAMAVLARTDRGISRAEDLVGKKVGTIKGTTSEYFLDTLLVANKVARDKVKVVELTAEELGEALTSGKVDAVTVWTPELSRLQQALGDKVVTLNGADVFVMRYLIAVRADYIASHPEELRKLMLALEESKEFIRTQPQLAQAAISKAIASDPALFAQGFHGSDYLLSLDQTLLLSLGEQTRWAMARGMAATGPVPNYLDHIRLLPLDSAQPNAIRIIR